MSEYFEIEEVVSYSLTKYYPDTKYPSEEPQFWVVGNYDSRETAEHILRVVQCEERRSKKDTQEATIE